MLAIYARVIRRADRDALRAELRPLSARTGLQPTS
jgi:hypothetical protein